MSTLTPEEAQSHPIEINGYAIVSDDDRIAGPDGLIPASLRNEKDWECFQRALASSDLVVLGRRSHELAPNVRGDQVDALLCIEHDVFVEVQSGAGEYGLS